MGPPRTHDAIPPEIVDEFDEWLSTRMGEDGFKDLVPVLEEKRWRFHRIICPTTYYRLSAEQMSLCRQRAHAILKGLGGTYKISGIVWYTDEGRVRGVMA